MQSYYGPSPAAKRFEVALCERELQLPEGVVRAWNGEVLRWGRGQQQGESFRGAALVDLPDGMKIRRTRSYQDRQPKCGFEPLTNPGECYLGASPKLRKGSNA